jgi:hypothetical protein
MQTPKIADDLRRFVVIHVAAKAENTTPNSKIGN